MCRALMSWVADHQQSGTIRRIDKPVAAKSGLLIRPDRTRIVRIGIDDDTWRSRSEQPVREGANERRTMAATKHIGFADKLIEAARPLGLRTETGIPGADIVTLQIGEFARIRRHNELCHIGMTKIAADKFELFG